MWCVTRMSSSGVNCARFWRKSSAESIGSSNECGPCGGVAQRWNAGFSSKSSSVVTPASSAASFRSIWCSMSTRVKYASFGIGLNSRPSKVVSRTTRFIAKSFGT